MRAHTVAFMAWRKGARTCEEIGPMINQPSCWFANRKGTDFNVNDYHKLKKKADIDPRMAPSKARLSILGQGKPVDMEEFNEVAESYGLSNSKAREMIGHARTGTMHPTVLHIKALHHVANKLTSTEDYSVAKEDIEPPKPSLWVRVKFLFTGRLK